MPNNKTASQIYNDKMDKIFEQAKENGAIAPTDKPINPFLLYKLRAIFNLPLSKAIQAVNMVRTLDN